MPTRLKLLGVTGTIGPVLILSGDKSADALISICKNLMTKFQMVHWHIVGLSCVNKLVLLDFASPVKP